MSLTRRTFLELVGSWLGGSALGLGAQRVIHENYFVAADLHAAFVKPSNWIFIPPETLVAEANEIGRAAFLGDLGEDASVMNISKEPWRTNPKRFTPGINIWYRPRAWFATPAACLRSFEDSQSFYPDFKVTVPAEACTLQDGTALGSTCKMTFTTIGIDRPTPVRCRLVVVEQPLNYLQISLCDAPELGRDESALFGSFLRSIRYVSSSVV
jgi:hypothetical protein